MRRGLAIAVAVLALAGCGGDDPLPTADKAEAEKPAEIELPGGGRIIFDAPKRRVVAFYGSPDDEELGTLGIGTPAQAAARLRRTAEKYATARRPVLPAMELLATVATADAGPDGLYRRRATHATIARYLRAARSIDALLILDIQPGRARFLPEAQRLERWLREPDVALALDPEWHVTADQIPGEVIGSVDATDVVATGAWLDELTARERLPQKLLLVHQFTEGMIQRRELLRPYANVAIVLNVDGFGDQPNKIAKYHQLAGLSDFAFNGFKLFYGEDIGLMTPRQVLRLKPPPDLVVYE
jgi:predicted small lipoprotein YifL